MDKNNILFNKDVSNFIKTKCIGITGSIAAGKSYLISVLEEKGYCCIDSDSLARQAYLKESGVYSQILDILNKYKVNKNSDDNLVYLIGKLVEDSSKESSTSLDTKILAKLFMMDRSLFKEIENIVHLYVKDSFYKIVDRIRKEWMEQNRDGFFFYESALLIESGWYKWMFKNVLLTCPLQTRIERMNERGYPSKEVFDFLSEYQMPDDRKKIYCDIEVDSSVDKKELIKNFINELKNNSIFL